MTNLQKWIWEAYFISIFFLTVQKAFLYFFPGSHPHFYFSILMSFDFYYRMVYTVTFVAVLLNLIHLIPLHCYIYGIGPRQPYFWKILFMLRILFDVNSYQYEINTLLSLFHVKPLLGWSVLGINVLYWVPSYIACFWFAFRAPSQPGIPQRI